jgi:hypothetical protein
MNWPDCGSVGGGYHFPPPSVAATAVVVAVVVVENVGHILLKEWIENVQLQAYFVLFRYVNSKDLYLWFNCSNPSKSIDSEEPFLIKVSSLQIH